MENSEEDFFASFEARDNEGMSQTRAFHPGSVSDHIRVTLELSMDIHGWFEDFDKELVGDYDEATLGLPGVHVNLSYYGNTQAFSRRMRTSSISAKR